MPIFYDKNGKVLRVRDKVLCKLDDGTIEEGIILYDKRVEEYMVFFKYSMWYGKDELDCNSYGKAYVLKDCNGEDLELIESYLKENE